MIAALRAFVVPVPDEELPMLQPQMMRGVRAILAAMVVAIPLIAVAIAPFADQPVHVSLLETAACEAVPAQLPIPLSERSIPPSAT